MILDMNAFDRFFGKVDARGCCWEWTDTPLASGYGSFGMSGKTYRAHRVAYEFLIGPIPRRLVLDHLCRNLLCVFPGHLEPVTQAENVRRGNSGRHWANKTHCPQDHEYTVENTYIGPSGSRFCRICHREQSLRYAAKKRRGLMVA